MVGRETSMSSLDKGGTRTEPRAIETHPNLIQTRRRSQLTDLDLASLGRMTTNEGDDNVRVTFSTYRRYIMDYFGGWKFIITSNLTIIAFTQCKLYNDYLLGVWSQNTGEEQHEEFYFYAYMIIGFSFLISFFVYLRAASMQIYSWYATRKLHNDMMHSVLNAPVPLYFDKTPLSRILNIFSKDLN
jgi:ABC-type multidrug transport system fused ATPase/permease subunit